MKGETPWDAYQEAQALFRKRSTVHGVIRPMHDQIARLCWPEDIGCPPNRCWIAPVVSPFVLWDGDGKRAAH